MDPVLIASIAVAEELDGQSRIRRQFLGVVADSIPEWFGQPCVVENTELVIEEVVRGSPGMTDVGERPANENPIPTRENGGDFFGVLFDEVSHGQPVVGGEIRFHLERTADSA